MAQFKHEQIFHGQTRRYGDTKTEYAITTDCEDEAEVLKYCNEVIRGGKALPSRREAGFLDPYYTLLRAGGKWYYNIIEPYDD